MAKLVNFSLWICFVISAISLGAVMCGFAHHVLDVLGGFNVHIGILGIFTLKEGVKKLKSKK